MVYCCHIQLHESRRILRIPPLLDTENPSPDGCFYRGQMIGSAILIEEAWSLECRRETINATVNRYTAM